MRWDKVPGFVERSLKVIELMLENHLYRVT